MPSAFSFSQEDIDHVLRLGGRNEHSRQMVAAEFMQGSSLEQIIDVLRIEYRGGQGLLTDHGRLSAWFDGEGIRLAQGDRVQDAAPVQFIPWQEAAARIGELLDEGKYATNVELAETAGHYRSELVQAIWYMRHDFSESAADRQLLPSLEAYLGGGYPAEERRLTDALTDPKILADVTRDMEIFSRVYALERGVLRFHYHHIPEMIAGLHALAKPWKEYTSDMAEVPKAGHFITDDEIDEAMSSGSHMAGGKNRIYSFFSEPHSTKEKADFLREEYGTGGFSGAFSNSSYSFMNYEGKGIRLSKEGFAEVTLSWNQAAKRVDSLIRSGRYFTEKEKAQMEQAQEVPSKVAPEVSATEESVNETSQADAVMGAMEPQTEDAFRGTLTPEGRFHVVEVNWYPGRQAYTIWDDQTGGYYADADGVTTDFANRWNAEEYCDELMEKACEAAARSLLDRAKDLIDQYCMEEFSVPADFDDMAKIGIGYTTISDEEIPMEVSVDLVEFRIERYLNDKLFDIRQYDSLESLISGELEHLDFNELMDATDDEIAESLMEDGSPADWRVVETEQELENREERNSGAGERRSVLADLKQKADQVPPPRRESDRSREEAL